MKTNPAKTKWMIYKELELIPDSMDEVKPRRFPFRLWLELIWEFCVDIFTRDSEPRIWERRDRTGKPYWYIYDPTTHESCCCFSQTEVCAWLERRYYNKHTPPWNNRNYPFF